MSLKLTNDVKTVIQKAVALLNGAARRVFMASVVMAKVAKANGHQIMILSLTRRLCRLAYSDPTQMRLGCFSQVDPLLPIL